MRGTSYLAVALRRKHDMLISDLDIYRSANVLIKHHGQDAPIEAAMRHGPKELGPDFTASLTV